MNEQEKKFVESIETKIRYFGIKTTLKEAIKKSTNQFVMTQYNNGESEIIDIGIEKFLCSLSPYYFIERYCYIDFPGSGVIPFRLYYFQKEILKEVYDYKKLVFLKTRQAGISTLFSLLCLHRCNFFESESIDVVSLKQEKAQKFIAKIEPTIQRLPPFLFTRIIAKSQRKIRWTNNSELVSEPASERAGRSDTLSLLILDEAAHYISDRLTRGIVGAAIPTLARTGGKMVTISTPNGTAGAGSYYHEQVEQLKMKGNSKEEKLFVIDWFEVPDIEGIKPYKGYNNVLQQYIRKNYYHNQKVRKEMDDFFKPISENWKNNEWLKNQFISLGEHLYKQEIMHDFVVSGNQVFSSDILDRLRETAKDPIEKDKVGTMGLRGFWIWKKPIPGHRYIMGIDVGSGTGQDTSSMEIFDVGEYEQVSEYKGYISTPAFSRVIKKVARYYNEAYLVIECNGIGEAIFNGIYYSEEDPYNNVYKKKKTKNDVVRMTGWETDVKSRRLITGELIDWFSVDELWEQVKIYSKRIYDEAVTWIWDGNKPVHASGCVSENTLILTKGGIKKIKDIVIGDLVLTHKGNFKKVLKCFKFKDETKQMLKITAFGKPELFITANQYFYIKNKNKYEFKNFEHIYNFKKIKTLLRFSDEKNDLTTIDLTKYNSKRRFDKQYIYWSNNKGKQKIKRFIDVDDLFLFFVGHVVSDGTVSKKGDIVITSSTEESEMLFDVYKKYFRDKFDINSRIIIVKNKNYKRFIVSNIILWNLFSEIGISQNKNIIKDLQYIDPSRQLKILYGIFFGDGHFGKSLERISLHSISPNIIFWLASVLYRNNIAFNFGRVNGRLRNNTICKEQFYVSILGEECFNFIEKNTFNDFFLIKKNYKDFLLKKNISQKNSKKNIFFGDFIESSFKNIEDIEWNDYYYDIEVEDDHSYIANGYIVHNSHDDTLMAMSLALYHRDKAINSSESFLITEDGDLVEYVSKDKEDEEEMSDFEYIMSSEDMEDEFQKKTGVSRKDYEWLIK